MSTADPIADAFAELPAPSTRCPLGRILDDASDVGRERLEAALGVLSQQEIIRRLAHPAVGLKISKDTISLHRSGRCKCVDAA